MIRILFPSSGLTPSISIEDTAEVVVSSGVMTELDPSNDGRFWYGYSYDGTPGDEYRIIVDGGVTIIENELRYFDFWANEETSGSGGGLTPEQNTKLFSLENSTGGGFSINYNAINSHTTSKVNELKEQIEKLPDYTAKLNEIQSQNDIAKGEIIDTIDGIDMPETDVSEITQGIGVLKQRFTKLSEYLRKESNTEKELIKKELEKKIEEIESIYKEMETAHSEEMETKTSELLEKEQLIAEMEETAQELMEEIEKEGKVNKDELEKEVKDKIISSLSE